MRTASSRRCPSVWPGDHRRRRRQGLGREHRGPHDLGDRSPITQGRTNLPFGDNVDGVVAGSACAMDVDSTRGVAHASTRRSGSVIRTIAVGTSRGAAPAPTRCGQRRPRVVREQFVRGRADRAAGARACRDRRGQPSERNRGRRRGARGSPTRSTTRCRGSIRPAGCRRPFRLDGAPAGSPSAPVRFGSLTRSTTHSSGSTLRPIRSPPRFGRAGSSRRRLGRRLGVGGEQRRRNGVSVDPQSNRVDEDDPGRAEPPRARRERGALWVSVQARAVATTPSPAAAPGSVHGQRERPFQRRSPLRMSSTSASPSSLRKVCRTPDLPRSTGHRGRAPRPRRRTGTAERVG